MWLSGRRPKARPVVRGGASGLRDVVAEATAVLTVWVGWGGWGGHACKEMRRDGWGQGLVWERRCFRNRYDATQAFLDHD